MMCEDANWRACFPARSASFMRQFVEKHAACPSMETACGMLRHSFV